MDSDARRILIINGKGGCGKTTIATNLAVAYAAKGFGVALIDNDPQASSTYWLEQRSPKLPALQLISAHQRSYMYETQVYKNRFKPGTNRVIVDGQSNARKQDLEMLLKHTDVVLVPMLPSAIDIHAGERFITELLTHRTFRSYPRPIGVIANRVQPNTPTHDKLNHFLKCLDVPTVATLRDSPVYTDAIGSGQGVIDMKSARAARKESVSWFALLEWIDAQGRSAPTTVQDLRLRGQPARAPARQPRHPPFIPATPVPGH